jgi:hypothetical protein
MRIDALLGEIVGLLETSLPQRVAGYYVQGSFADASGVGASNIDLTHAHRRSRYAVLDPEPLGNA